MTLKQRDYTPQRAGHARRRARARPLAPRRRQRAHAGPRRLRRRGDQGRAARGRHAARLAARRACRPTGRSTRATRRACASSCASRKRASCCSSSCPTAAVFVESFRPGTLEKMGLAPETLLERNPKLVIVRISGFGQDGPVSPASRLRHAGRRHVGLRVVQRLRRPRAGAAADVPRRRVAGLYGASARDDRAARSRAERRARAR